MFSSNKFFLFIINLSILGFSQVGFSLRPKQVLKHLGHTQHLPTPPINNTTILFAILIGKESASLEYLIDTILKIEFQQIYLAHHQQLRILSWECTPQPGLSARYKRCQWLPYYEQVILSFS